MKYLASEFRCSLRVLYTRTDVRVDGCTSGDVELLVPVSAWNLVTSEFMHGTCYVFAFGVFTQTLRYFFYLVRFFTTMMVFYLSYLVGLQSQAGASGFIRFIGPSA